VEQGHADVAEDPVRQVRLEQRGEALVAVGEGVRLEKMILATVPTKFEFRAKPICRAMRLCNADAFFDALEICVEVKRPLV